MAKTSAPRIGQRTTFRSGPYTGVVTDRDPYNDPPDKLTRAKNLYFPNPKGGVGAYSRPGFSLAFGGTPLVTSATPFRGQCVYSHPALDATTINFIVMGGRLFRVAADLSTATDVTPVGITIDSGIMSRVFMISLIGNLVVTDGINRPWIATDLTSTPITGTYIDYDGNGVAWTTYGAPWLYQNTIFVILAQVNGVSRRTDVSWCQPGDPSTGWQQSDFDNNWTLVTSSDSVLYAGEGTDNSFFYWRELSIGAATGTVGPDLASSATVDAVSFDVGTQACQTIQKFGSSFFFCDANGRPWRFTPGTPPEPIWYQMRGVVETASAANPITTTIVATSVIEPTLNKYLVGIYSPNPATQAAVNELHVFDAVTATYEGIWSIGDDIGIDCIGKFVDSAGRTTLVALAAGGQVWTFNSLTSAPQDITTEGGGLFLCEDVSTRITTEGSEAVWQDDGARVDVQAETGRFGYADDINYNLDQATVVTLTDAPISVSVETSACANTLEGIPQPSASYDDTFRLVCGLDAFGRGPRVTVAPLETDDQWVLQSISVTAIASAAGPEDS